MATVDLKPDRDTGETAEGSAGSTYSRLRAHLRDPMSRSGYSLVLGSAITSALGMGFWVLAARLYDAEHVGTTSALIAAMGFLASASTIGLKNGFIRFLPVAGAAGPRFIRNAYLLCIGVSSVAALVFLLGQGVWAKELSMLRAGPLPMVFFVVATASWTIFVLQDSVLTGLRLASWVPAENAVFAVAKLLLLVALVGLPAWGIFVAWSIPSIALLLPVNLLILRRLRKRPAVPQEGEGIAIADVVRFAAGDHAAAFLWLGTTELLSLVVLAQAGAESSAFYFLSFQIAYSLYLVTSNFSSAFVVEAAIHPDQESVLLRKALVQSARLVVPAALIATAGAPLLLRVMGGEYEANAVPLLRLLLLSAIPQILVGVSVGRARLHRHVRIVILVYFVTAIALFSGATFGLRAGGLEAVGWTWLCTQLVVGLALTPTVLHPPLGHWIVSKVLRRASSVRTGMHQRGRSVSARSVMPLALTAAGSDEPTKYTLLPSHHDSIVARGSIDGDPVVVRIAMTDIGAAALDDNAEMIERLAAHRRLSRWRAVVPALVHRGTVEGRRVAVESFLPGTTVDRLSGDDRAAAIERAQASISTMHRATARTARFDDSVAHRWIDDPLAVLERLPALAGRSADLQQLRTWLRSQLVGREVELCWVHGDFWAGNVLVTDAGSSSRVTGIIDWENGRLDGFAELDSAHLWLTERPGEMGAALTDALAAPGNWPATRTDADGSVVVDASGLPARAVLVLAWLGHVAAGAGRSTDHPPSRVWVRRNVLAVLDRTDELTGPEPVATTVSDPEPDARAEPEAEPEPEIEPEVEPEPAYFEVSDDAVADLDRPARPTTTREAPEPSDTGQRRIATADVGSIALVLGAVAAWVYGIWGADPRQMTEFGLISLFTPPMVAALALLTAGFVLAVRRAAPGWVLGLHVVALIALVHGTPPVLYDTLRYSWAWKHTGIVEYITRTGSVDTTIGVTPIYHSWPGFFAGSALLTELIGARHSARIAMWTPLAINLANLLALRFLFRSLTVNRRVVWLSIWFFFITNWVGQDYFSPQAMAYLLYVVVIAVALRGFGRADRRRSLAGRMDPKAAFAVLATLLLAIASSHQITPFLAMVVLAGLVLFRQARGWYLPVVAALLMGVWAFTVGNGELSKNTQSLVDSFGKPIANAEETFEKASNIAPSQQLVSQAGRLVVVALAALAFVGLVRLWRRRAVDPAVLIIAATPAALPFATEFGGEAIFRVFLFAVPAMAMLAAWAVEPATRPNDGSARWGVVRSLALFVLSAALLCGFTVAHYGKDQQYFFTQGEIDAMTWVAEHADPGSLLVEASRNYPSQFLRYEYFTYVAIDREPADSQERVLDDPVGRLALWLENAEYADTFILITRSQRISSELSGSLPEGTIERIETLLRGSSLFHIAFQNDDAVVFRLAKDVTT